MKLLRVSFVFVLFASSLSFAADAEFRGVVHAIESQYGVRHTHIPLLGFALFFARPEGVSGVKLAVFEDFHGPTAVADVSRIVEHSLGPEWYPFVRIRSKDDDEATIIYTSPSGGRLRMMIVNVESSEATVIELKLSEHAIKRWLEDPKDNAKDSSHSRHSVDN
jgi:hypothetical protein